MPCGGGAPAFSTPAPAKESFSKVIWVSEPSVALVSEMPPLPCVSVPLAAIVPEPVTPLRLDAVP